MNMAARREFSMKMVARLFPWLKKVEVDFYLGDGILLLISYYYYIIIYNIIINKKINNKNKN